jgi:Protein of unknown function (DUF2865).
MIDLSNARKALRATGTVFLLLVPAYSITSYAEDRAPEVVAKGALVPTQSLLWFFGGPSDRNELERERPAPLERPAVPSSGTVCVRLCDGYFWPISQSPLSTDLRRAAKQCEQACPGRSRLFRRSLDQDPADMTDLEGRPYSKLENAFRHQREYVADCKCQPSPWEDEALARHRAYAAARANNAENKGTSRRHQSAKHGVGWKRTETPRRASSD